MDRKLVVTGGMILVALGLMLLQNTRVDDGLMLQKQPDDNVGITYVDRAVLIGAVCLDGSPPAYHLDKGFGSGKNNWLVHHEGGGWCNNVTRCLDRTNTRLGSSKKMEKLLAFIGILSNQQKHNPDFYNWNRVLVRYCDGASFTGDVEDVDPGPEMVMVKIHTLSAVNKDILEVSWYYEFGPGVDASTVVLRELFARNCLPLQVVAFSVCSVSYLFAVAQVTNLHFRGARVFDAVMEHLLAKGMKNAENALLTGCSAGGLTVTLHCDKFRDLFPKATKVKCVSDAGYFINVKDITGTPSVETYYGEVVATHGSAKHLPPSCISNSKKPVLCFFQQNVVQLVKTPLFIVNSGYDPWQIQNILAPNTTDPEGLWIDCKYNLSKCSTDQLKIIEDLRLKFLDALQALGSSSSRGTFIDSCFEHDQITVQRTWYGDDSPVLDGKKMANAVGDWYNKQSTFQIVDDCNYPCKNCPRL